MTSDTVVQKFNNGSTNNNISREESTYVLCKSMDQLGKVANPLVVS